ncbi:MAG: trehalose-6-phosphate synthase [Deltaproteobacteria bacterium]|nr:trehalose-6-phosphate synthase [Deltaproteobacteria bacterium]
MPRSLLLLAGLLGALALLAVVGDLAMRDTTRRWFERDVDLRSRLAVGAARQSLEQQWSSDPAGVATTLRDITRDERIMGAAACLPEGKTLATTELYPREFSCRLVLERRRQEEGSLEHWTLSTELPSGPVLLSVLGVGAPPGSLGEVVLVHDLSFVQRRDATTRRFLIASYFVLALVTSLVTLLGARFAWRRWRREMLRAFSGEGRREFQPLVRDVRALLDRLAHEHGHEARGGSWSPARLRETLARYLEGERVVILANREPYIHDKTDNGVRVLHPASGLVTALEPVMRACSGVWVAHGSGSADRDTVDAHDRVRVPPGEESYLVRRIWLSEEEENGYYYGFSNEGLWPLCHIAHARPVFRAEDWAQYQAVNQRFADAVCDEVDSDDPIVLVQDYHFALAPRMIRKRLPRATILTFWHIPWPNVERIGICPWREEILTGLLGSSILGFHTAQHCRNFIESIDAFLESRIDREANAIVQGHRRTLVRPYPISIEWPVHWLDQVPPVDECRRSVRAELGLPADALLGVGVDRLDYTKGIEERFAAVDALLAGHDELRGRFVFVQLAAPSRTKIPRYHELNERVEEVARTINARWGQGDYQPIRLLHAHHEPATVFRYYRAAELCYVSSLHDGMNLVAKEFVAARDDGLGVLLLSQFTGAARDLTEALIVNPYDTQQAANALAAALQMPESEQRERMLSMRRMVAEFNVYRWAGRMIIDAAELRRRERMADRLTSWRGALALEHP